jgi:ribosomal protein S12 methylthiotransferase
VEEADRLAAAGTRELNLVAQDTTAYGSDLSTRSHLGELLAALQRVEGLAWIRVLYTYPSAVDQRLIEAVRDLPKVVPYLDIPVQHVDDQLLQRMRRGYTGSQVRGLIARLRRQVPEIFLRTTLLIGHPGETADSQRALLDFVAEVKLDHLGVFPFSIEEGTAAATQDRQVPAQTTLKRVEEVMELQRHVSRGRLARLREKKVEVLVEGPSPESPYLLQGRHAGQAPEVDGVVVLTSCQARPGDLVQVRITDTGDYDLVAEPIQG